MEKSELFPMCFHGKDEEKESINSNKFAFPLYEKQ